MYVNKCIKCGAEFETKNPKRVICPDCLYPDKKMSLSSDMNDGGSQQNEPRQQEEQQSQQQNENVENKPQQYYSSYSQDSLRQGSYQAGYHAGGYSSQGGYDRERSSYNRGGYDRDRNNQGGGYNRGGYNRNNNQGGGYNRGGYDRNNQGGRPQNGGGYNRGGYNRNNNQGGGYNRGGYDRNNQGGRPQGFNRNQGGFGRPRPQGGSNRFNKRPPKQAKPLLVDKVQLEQIENLYKAMLPLPNPDAHETIGAQIGLEPKKVFFGINLVRQKMMLPKLPFPKRKLAITPDQMFAIQNLYEPLLPLPPIGCHKIIAAQLKMDEWRVHVGIGLIRAKLGLGRWNEDRADAPEEFRNKSQEEKAEKKSSKTAKEKKSEDSETEKKPRKTTKKAKADSDEE